MIYIKTNKPVPIYIFFRLNLVSLLLDANSYDQYVHGSIDFMLRSRPPSVVNMFKCSLITIYIYYNCVQ